MGKVKTAMNDVLNAQNAIINHVLNYATSMFSKTPRQKLDGAESRLKTLQDLKKDYVDAVGDFNDAVRNMSGNTWTINKRKKARNFSRGINDFDNGETMTHFNSILGIELIRVSAKKNGHVDLLMSQGMI